MKFDCYVLQKGLSSYFQKLETNKNVVYTSSPFKANLFQDKNTAIKFQRILKNDYQEENVIIKL